MQSQAGASPSKRTLFHGVILLQWSETDVQVPTGLPASLWKTDSLDGGGVPFRAARLLIKCVLSVGWDSRETLLSGTRNLPFWPEASAALTPSLFTVR